MSPAAAVYAFTIILMTAEIGWILTKGSRTKQTFSFVACQILLNIWSASQILLLEAVNVRQLFLAYCVGNGGICLIGTAWLMLTFYSSGRALPKKAVLCSAFFSAAMLTVSVTNNFHGLFYSTFSLEQVEHGILFYLNIAHTYLCMITGTSVLCRSVPAERAKRRQTVLLVLSAVIPFIANVLFLFGAVEAKYDITPFAFSVSSILLLLATNKYGFLNVNDIAFENALENIEEGTAVFRRDGTLSYANDTMKKLFHLNEASTVYGLFGGENLSARELDIDGRIISLKAYRNLDKKGKLLAVAVIASDVTEFYDAARRNQELAEANERLAVESERNRIAQEVHDTAGHTLTMINSLSKLTYIAAGKGSLDEVKQYSHEAQELSSQGIAQLRVSINNLRKKSENSLITDGLKQLVKSARGISAELCIQGEDSVRYSFCSNVIYENTREAVTNCLKYSDADRMDIIVKLLEESVEVYIFDNGRGCSAIEEGNGLRGMRERTEKIGGSIKFTSVEESGFSIIMKFPIMKGKNDD